MELHMVDVNPSNSANYMNKLFARPIFRSSIYFACVSIAITLLSPCKDWYTVP